MLWVKTSLLQPSGIPSMVQFLQEFEQFLKFTICFLNFKKYFLLLRRYSWQVFDFPFGSCFTRGQGYVLPCFSTAIRGLGQSFLLFLPRGVKTEVTFIFFYKRNEQDTPFLNFLVWYRTDSWATECNFANLWNQLRVKWFFGKFIFFLFFHFNQSSFFFCLRYTKHNPFDCFSCACYLRPLCLWFRCFIFIDKSKFAWNCKFFVI